MLTDHPFKTLVFFRGEEVRNWSNLPTDSSIKLPTAVGRGQNCVIFANVLNGETILRLTLVQINNYCENKPPLEPEHASPHLRLVFFEGVFSVEYPKLPTDIGLYWDWREMMEVKGPKEKIVELRNLKRNFLIYH